MKISGQISFCLEVLPDKFKNYFRLCVCTSNFISRTVSDESTVITTSPLCLRCLVDKRKINTWKEDRTHWPCVHFEVGPWITRLRSLQSEVGPRITHIMTTAVIVKRCTMLHEKFKQSQSRSSIRHFTKYWVGGGGGAKFSTCRGFGVRLRL